MSKEKYRSRVHMLLLYPDNIKHCQAIEKIKQQYDYALILHNRDVDSNGELKKEHWHVVLRFLQPVWSSAICKDLEIEDRFIEHVKKFENALQYLIHYNDIDKAQYPIDEVQGTLKKRLSESISKFDKSEGERISEIITYIQSQDDIISVTEFSIYCANVGYWAEFRRGSFIILKIIEEHNNEIRAKCTK